MSLEGQALYPGEIATAAELLALADAYRNSADTLLTTGRRGQALSWAPYRLVALHAVELYLNAYLISIGHTAAAVRRLQHDTASRTHLTAANLRLRKRTILHLESVSSCREYLAARYDPAPSSTSQLNRLQATLTEVAHKVSTAVSPAQALPAPKGNRQPMLAIADALTV